MNAMDANGKADPYVKVVIGKQKRQTKTCPKTLEPKFKERMDFMVTDLTEKCEFKVYDEDFMDADDLMVCPAARSASKFVLLWLLSLHACPTALSATKFVGLCLCLCPCLAVCPSCFLCRTAFALVI